MFRGFLDGRSIIIKKFMETRDEARSMAIIISMQMTNHKNVLKLLGSIFLDHDYAPKLSNFELSITIPPMKSHANDEAVVFLTGQKAVDAYEAGEYQSIIAYVKASDIGQIQTIADPKILGEVGGDEQARRHLHDFLALALLCTQEESEVRPDMMDVAKELLRIEKSIISK
ncbi:PREDICTED: non-functional pseudokinase ZED1 [Prunus dulcis]|uniref:PREDICTED: non-functional pseudokinase ZED1 n=1 Tax=Prunus dulcis TaxID=3755 RepID=A0A5E4ELP9_PRUDU|nr:PREDICTED: non-functional pseudokinase ZED1 [Prunus dulcis]